MYCLRQIFSRSMLVTIVALLIVTPPQPAEASLRLCGSRLTQTLLAVCRNQLCGGMMKRSAPDTSFAPSTHDLFFLHHQQKRGGIATECCEKRCSLSYLKTFCCNQDDNF